MTNKEFQKELQKYRFYLKPELYDVLTLTSSVFSEEARMEIVDKFREAEAEMKELADYQQERIGILKRGLNKINEYYKSLKTKFKQAYKKEKAKEKKEADDLITNL
jgi:hypothetical protein